ncbi:Odorant receptor 49b [Gryllus bimaculatus]|nr:Odorant receptor 49b [Gryllus bimaculatus]
MAYTLIAALYELSMFSYFANALIEESQGVGYSAYCSEWFHSSLSYRRSVTLVMVRSRRPCVLTYGKFADLSLESLAGILRISYTFFTVLNGVNE